MQGSHKYAVIWWVNTIAKHLPAINISHLHFILSRELRALGTTYSVTTKAERPSGPIFNAFFEMGINAGECFARLPADITMWVSEDRVMLMTERGTTILYADDWEYLDA